MGYIMAMHRYIINKPDNNEYYSFCNVRLMVDHYGTAKKQRRRNKEPSSKITSETREKTE
jgi:hypothetical protein